MSTVARGARRRAPADPALRLRLQRMLGGAELEPEAMPPSAVLVVRALGDPLPRRLRAGGREARASAEWARAVRGALADRLHAAARPSRGVLPADAEAVLFADQAELLAAFARDACAGVAGARWWWNTLARGLGAPADALATLWLREPRHVPAALEHLAGWGEAGRVAASLSPVHAARILGAVARAFELPGLFAAPPPNFVREMGIGGSGNQDRAARSSPSPEAVRAASADTTDADGAFDVAAPWEMVLGPSLVSRSLAPEQRALLGVSLALHRAPLVARGPAFVARFVRWRAWVEARSRPEPPRTTPPVRDRPPPDAPRAPPLPTPPPAARSAAADAPTAVRDEAPRLAAGDSGEREVSNEAHASPSPSPEASTSPDEAGVARNESRDAEADAVRAVAEVAPSPGVHPPTAAEEGWTEPLPSFTGPTIEAAETMSAACGVFYLVNVVRSLGFFRALDAHFRLPSVVGGWGWIELLARALLGPRAAGLAHDPVWRVLAGLDGRDAEEPVGTGFLAPAVWTLPGDWAAILRDAGGAAPAPSPPLGIDPSPELGRFLDLVVPFVRLRLEAALRAGGANEALESALVRRIGRIQATRAHVDVRMEMDQVSVAVRVAGLDANPGWVPELARVVTFHFA
ncbi:MAG TPA: hypothetical protein VEX86_23660 [Longimicrobium sp.]|nr:hypothetical protein [Longimicrobium sp.]